MSLDFNDVKIPVFERWFGSWQVSVNRRGFEASELSAAYDAEAELWEEKIARLGFPGGYRRLVQAVLPALSCGAGQQLKRSGLRDRNRHSVPGLRRGSPPTLCPVGC
jgi:hypothetical protein